VLGRCGHQVIVPRLLTRGSTRPVPAGFARLHGRVNRNVSRHLKGARVLELRPTCENCNKVLPPDSLEARICTYECTFCATCVDTVLENVCPNCGGGFVPRPIRPSKNWKGDNFLGKDPASTKVKHRPVDPAAHARFAAAIKTIPPHRR
jgi:hypothetical protein